MIIGITGGIGAGKSTVSNILRSMGYPVYDSDIQARKLQNENVELKKNIQKIFGEDIYNESGLDRPALSKIVFKNPELLAQLNNIVHPVVLSDFKAWVKSNSQAKAVFIESAILFESGFNKLTNKIILVTASEEIRIARVVKRDGISHEQVRERIQRQTSDEVKKKCSDAVIYTDNGRDTLAERIESALLHLLSN